MALVHPENIYMAVPINQIDQIIGIQTGSFGIVAPTASGPTTASSTFTTGFGDTCFFQGIFSTDGGSSWNDFGTYRPNLSTPTQPVFQTVSCFGYVTSSGIFTAAGVNWYDFVHSIGNAYTIQYKVAFLAKSDQGSITPISTNEVLTYSSANNYQKIYLQSSFANSGSNTVIAHNLGYIPKVRVYFKTTNSTAGTEGVYTVPAGAMMTLDWFYPNIYVDSSNLTITPVIDNVGTVAGTVYYIIYLDS